MALVDEESRAWRPHPLKREAFWNEANPTTDGLARSMASFVGKIVEDGRLPISVPPAVGLVVPDNKLHSWDVNPSDDRSGGEVIPAVLLRHTTEMSSLSAERCRYLTQYALHDTLRREIAHDELTVPSKYVDNKLKDIVSREEKKWLVAAEYEGKGVIAQAIEHIHGDKKRRLVMLRTGFSALWLNSDTDPNTIWDRFIEDMQTAHVISHVAGEGESAYQAEPEEAVKSKFLASFNFRRYK